MRILFTLLFAFLTQISIAQDFKISTLSYKDVGDIVLTKTNKKGEEIWNSNLVPKNRSKYSAKNIIGAISKKDSVLYLAVANKDIIVYKVDYKTGSNLGQIKITNSKNYSSLLSVSLPVENIYSGNPIGNNKLSDIVMAIDDYGSIYINYYRFDHSKPLASSYFSKFNINGNKIWEKELYKVNPYGKNIYTGVKYMDELEKGCLIATRSEGGLGYVQIYDNSKIPENEYQWAFKSKNYNSQNNNNLYYTYFTGSKKKGYTFKIYNIEDKSIIDRGVLNLGPVKVDKNSFSYDVDKDQSSVFSFLTYDKTKLEGESKKTKRYTNTIVSFDSKGEILAKKELFSKEIEWKPILKILSLNSENCYNNGKIEMYDITFEKLLNSKDLLDFGSTQEELIYKSKNDFIFKSSNNKFILVDLVE